MRLPRGALVHNVFFRGAGCEAPGTPEKTELRKDDIVTDKKRLIAAAVINIIIFIVTAGIVVSYFFGNDGEYHIDPLGRFRLFTTDSNILCAVTSFIAAICEIRILAGKSEALPLWAQTLKYIGTVAVLLTFTVVVTFLGPTMGYIQMLFVGTSVYMHLLGPVLAFASFVFLEEGTKLAKRVIPLGALSIFIYGIYYLIRFVFIEPASSGWYDFYGFNIGGFWYISFIAVNLVGIGLAAVIRLLHNIKYRKR